MSSTLTGENGSVNINESAVESLCKAGTLINELYTALPKTDGWVQKIVGEQDLKDFGTSCETFAESMKTISDSLTTV